MSPRRNLLVFNTVLRSHRLMYSVEISEVKTKSWQGHTPRKCYEIETLDGGTFMFDSMH